MNYRVTLNVMLKPGVLDSPGQTLQRALHSLGYSEVGQVAVGRALVLEVEAPDEAALRRRIEEMAARLLVNPVVERYDYTVESAARV